MHYATQPYARSIQETRGIKLPKTLSFEKIRQSKICLALEVTYACEPLLAFQASSEGPERLLKDFSVMEGNPLQSQLTCNLGSNKLFHVLLFNAVDDLNGIGTVFRISLQMKTNVLLL